MKCFKYIVLSLVVCCSLLLVPHNAPALTTNQWIPVQVLEPPYDGDTIKVKMPFPFNEISVRIAGLDTPEMANKSGRWPEQPGAREARDYLRTLIKPNDWVWIKIQSQSYGRLVAYVKVRRPVGTQSNNKYVFTEDDVSMLMLKKGLAHIDARFTKKGDVRWAILAKAKKDRQGIYARDHPTPCAPRVWRKYGKCNAAPISTKKD